MFFLIEMLMDWIQSKRDEYEKAMYKWIKDGENSSGYNYRSEYDYRQRFGEGPFYKLKVIMKVVGFVLLGLFTALWLTAVVANSIAESEQEQKKAYAGHSCKAHEVGDHVKVDYGVWKDATGTIIGGCGTQEDYQVKLDKQMYNVDNDGNSDPVEVENKVISVDTYKNLIKIEKVEYVK